MFIKYNEFISEEAVSAKKRETILRRKEEEKKPAVASFSEVLRRVLFPERYEKKEKKLRIIKKTDNSLGNS